MPQRVDIAITGSGSLGTEILLALARANTEPLSIALLGRDMDRLTALAQSATDLSRGGLQLKPIVIDWSDDALRRVLAELQPRVLVHTASWQSPWALAGNDQWSNLIRGAGFGFTLPLQSVLALRVARALADQSPATVLINGCYPDAVNQILFANGLKVSGGIGNVAIIASLLWSGLPLSMKQGRRLRVVGHHAHLAAAVARSELKDARLKAWLDEEPIHDVAAEWFRNAQLQSNMNDIAAAAAVPMLHALLGGPSSQVHSPGPLGLPGGYPVIVSEGRIELDLPDDITLAEAKTLNTTAGIADGLIVRDDGYVVLAESSREALTRFLPDEVSDFMTWPASEVEARADRLVSLRKSLL